MANKKEAGTDGVLPYMEEGPNIYLYVKVSPPSFSRHDFFFGQGFSMVRTYCLGERRGPLLAFMYYGLVHIGFRCV